MANAQPEEKPKEEPHDMFQMKDHQAISMDSAKPTTSRNNPIPLAAAAKQTISCSSGSGTSGSSNGTGNGVSFKFNAHAPEFVPKSHTQMPISGYYYPCFHYLGGGAAAASDWFFLGEQETSSYLNSNPNLSVPNCSSKNVLTDDLRQMIIKQVEYQFSDMSLIANESLSKQISKDPEGYVPISFIASTKKIKSLITNHQLLAQALRSSLKLVVSDDGKKVRRKHPFTEKEREQVQSRTIIVENLPEDHSHQNLDKIFNVVGSVKNIRICHPQECNSSRSKNDYFMSNKLHALVEYESTRIAEKAVEKLNDERNWRKGLRVRLLLRLSPKSVLKTRKSEFDGILDEDDSPHAEYSEGSSPPNNAELFENSAEDSAMGSKKGWSKLRGKLRGCAQSLAGRGLLPGSPQPSNAVQCEASVKQMLKGPRMPDGTRGFTMGRGKPICSPLE
ncbi:La-related protein 6C [Hibiscus syriacus]|uniref:La-related protein 6C n=1 Tax=Hibiscus syriacus TaxID=106335 RepID=A0A6A2YBM6_HIBSY|nr:la-related protein 6C-like [Hibiscus syriacus]KAE8669997.1 La-related protein 6C [Hibiscus syriacus]